VLVGASDHPAGLPAEREVPDAAAALRRLKLSLRETPLEPLVSGEWA
jgi:hypothetical protein